MVSAGAACSSGKVGPSHVLEAMGLPRGIAGETIRISLGWTTTEADIDHFLDAWTALARRATRKPPRGPHQQGRISKSRMSMSTALKFPAKSPATIAIERANRRPVYLDNQSTTPLDPRVLEAMMPYFTEQFGNPHSESHVYGKEAAAAIEAARADVARLIGADPREIVFTSGATEANNLALKGAAHFARAHPQAGREPRDRIVTLATEHKCVLESAVALQREGFPVVSVPVEPNGLVSLERLADALDEHTLIVSVMAAHNEIGVIQPLAEIGALCRSRGVLFHTDAAQAFGKIPLDVEAMKIDLMSISGHKIYGPKGVGALYVRRRPRVRLLPLIDGGGQERGLRSGTLPTPLCVGLGRAAALAAEEMDAEAVRLRRIARPVAGTA